MDLEASCSLLEAGWHPADSDTQGTIQAQAHTPNQLSVKSDGENGPKPLQVSGITTTTDGVKTADNLDTLFSLINNCKTLVLFLDLEKAFEPWMDQRLPQ